MNIRRWLVRFFVVLLALQCAFARADCVVLIHGLARSSSSMARIARALRAQDFEVINVDYKSRSQSIAQLAPIAIESGVERCSDDTTIVHFVTHSLGGILVRYYLAEHPLPRLGRVVMLAPPNNGSEVVDAYGWIPGFSLITGPVGEQLGTGESSVPRRLGPVDYPVGVVAGTRSLSPIFSLSLPNPDDGRVSVASAKVRGMTDFIAVPHSHTFIVRSRTVIREIAYFLEHGKFCKCGTSKFRTLHAADLTGDIDL